VRFYEFWCENPQGKGLNSSPSCAHFFRTNTMASFQQLQQQKAELDLKIAQSMDAAKRMAAELEQAQIRHEEIETGTAQIMALMEKYNLSKEDLFPGSSPSKVTNLPLKECVSTSIAADHTMTSGQQSAHVHSLAALQNRAPATRLVWSRSICRLYRPPL
jgi:antitoxin component HigA of HigAB toxin-antitoxin module